ncbi:zinc transporter ZIP10 [Bacillus rossius redtenbacheri]|uniref:zinc transporter ZIP10 n=1 Tax=Bacillus rossius redtenbacheri TaxID=93214 RepID=UPI002FDD136D
MSSSLTLLAWLACCCLAAALANRPADHRLFLREIFSKYGAHGVITFEGFEHLLANLGLGRLQFDKNHSVALHRVNGSFRDVHDSLRLHNHSHGRDRRHVLAEYEPELRRLVAREEEGNSSAEGGGTPPRACLTPQAMLAMYGLQPSHAAVISPLAFLHMCPAIVYELDQRACRAAPARDRPRPGGWKWLYAGCSVLAVSATGLAGVLLVPLAGSACYRHVQAFLVALAAGTLCGDALLHLLPHAILSSRGEPAASVLQGAAVFGALCVFFTLEAVFSARGQDGSAKENNAGGKKKAEKDDLQDATEMGSMLEGGRHHHHHTPRHGGPGAVVQMVLMGDGLHNLTDGLAIGAAFGGDTVTGLATTVAVFFHELPHELGDFAVLIESGVSVRRAVLYSVFSSVLSFIGMAIGLWLGDFEAAGSWISSFTAGTFLYIALANLVPEMKASRGGLPGAMVALLRAGGVATGGAVMLAIALFEDSILTMFGS